jgi:hypothetical protein
MIPKASQRSGGQDLATHLLNAHDNEYVEVAEVRGAVANDLHGAFAEWEVQARGLTRCRNYLYSLSISPDPAQGEWTREQYADFVERAEERLGLAGQPRAVVFHIKAGREHCHVAWSRIDVVNEKAIHQAFDHEKLMMVARQFARDHNLELPDRMQRGEPGNPKDRLTLYDRYQEQTTGLTKEERVAAITKAWGRCDSAKAFVAALQGLGYTLATGNRPYVLVDRYGGTYALPRMIDDRQVRTKDIVAFLEKEFAPESLPTVEEAKALVDQHQKVIEEFAKAQARSDRVDILRRMQAERRTKIEQEQAALARQQSQERSKLEARQSEARQALRHGYLEEVRQIRAARAARAPTGLAAFLGRVTGVQAVLHTLHRHQDKKRYERYAEGQEVLGAAQRDERALQQRGHELKALDMQRQLRALSQVEQRELRALENDLLRQVRIKGRGHAEHMPGLSLKLTPKGRPAAPYKAKNRYARRPAEGAEERCAGTFDRAVQRVLDPLNLSEAFSRAASGGEAGGQGSSDGAAARPRPDPPTNPRAPPRRSRDPDRDRER